MTHRMALPSLIDDTPTATTCNKCKAEMGARERYCPSCGADREVEWKVAGLEMTKLAKARNWILGIGVWYVISGALMYLVLRKQYATDADRDMLLGTTLVLFVLHLGLYVWAKTAPLAAAIAALCLFVTVHVANAAIEPSTIYKGIVIKVAFVLILAKAIQAGLEIHRLRNQRA
jgi:hypothetical protein